MISSENEKCARELASSISVGGVFTAAKRRWVRDVIFWIHIKESVAFDT